MTDERLVMSESERLQAENADLRRQLTIQRENNERRNRQLDALGVVWCSGGCEGGMSRYHPSREVTADMVVELVLNARRAVSWYINHAGKSEDSLGNRCLAWDSALADLQKKFGEAFALAMRS